MERIPEHELMDNTAQAKAYAEADYSEPHEAFVKHFKVCFPGFSSGTVLDLGCGPADVTIRFARAFPKTRITGIDGAQVMLDLGLREIKLQELDHQMTLKKCRLPDSELSNLKFDALISNSLLHHLPDPAVMWQAVKLCTGHGAHIFVMDLLRPSNIETAKEIVQQYANDAPEVLKTDFYNSLLAAFSIEEIQEQLKTSGLEYLAVEIVSDRHFIVWGQKAK